MDVALADPVIARARIDFVRAAARAYQTWVAAGARLQVARELLQLAEARVQALQAGVARQFFAAIDVTDNERLIAQRRVLAVRAERQLQQAALELSLFLRDADDAPIVPDNRRLPPQDAATASPDPSTLQEETERAVRQRPELRRLQLQIARTETDLDLARNATLPDLDLVVEATRQSSDQPYSDRTMDQLFVGGELKLPAQRREARGRVDQATTQLSRLRLELGFARDRAVNDVADARSALTAAHRQAAATTANVELAVRMVAAEQRAFELGRSDLLRVQQREQQLAEARTLAIDTLLDYHRAAADHRAALGTDGVVAAVGGR
jgi:outer membrane protein TolC